MILMSSYARSLVEDALQIAGRDKVQRARMGRKVRLQPEECQTSASAADLIWQAVVIHLWGIPKP